MQPRDSGQWWADQDGTEWSAFGLWKATSSWYLRTVMWDDEAGVRICIRNDGELRHLIRIPPPEAPEEEKATFYEEWETLGQPPY